MNPTSAVVLLSSGLDSSFNLYRAAQDLNIKLALTFDYGQRAAKREVESASRMAAELGLPHRVIDLKWFREFTRTSLVGGGHIPSGSAISIDDHAKSQETAKAVWVPNRNGIFLNIAAGFAEGLGADVVIPGFNSEEAATFPDNSQAFLDSLDTAWGFSTEGRVKTFCYSTNLDKTEIVKQSLHLSLPFSMLWPCYLDGEQWCGTCESCQRFKRAVEKNGLVFEALRKESGHAE